MPSVARNLAGVTLMRAGLLSYEAVAGCTSELLNILG